MRISLVLPNVLFLFPDPIPNTTLQVVIMPPSGLLGCHSFSGIVFVFGDFVLRNTAQVF